MKAVEPLNASSNLLPDVTCNGTSETNVRLQVHTARTAENVEALTLLPHANFPLTTPHFPFDEVKVKMELDPAIVYVARVCVDQVPAERRPPVVLALIVALVGMLPGAYRKEGKMDQLLHT